MAWRDLRETALLMAGLLCIGPARAAAPLPSPVRFDIARQPLADALPLFARQADRSLLFAPDLVRGLEGAAVHGRLLPDRALARLLHGTGLRATLASGGAFLIAHREAGVARPDRLPPGTAPAPLRPRRPLPDQPVPEIVVVGTPAGGGARRQDAAFAVSAVDAARIGRLAPNTPADVLRLIPGLTVETSGGKNGANIFVRGYPSAGDAEYVTFEAEGVPFFPPATLSFLENSQLIRIDETVARVEAVRGGTGALVGAGQPGVTVNIVQREGGAALAGLVKTTVTSFGDRRMDALISGPLAGGSRFMIGGYYGSGHGIRSPGFAADRGGQITANLRHDLADGSLLLFARFLNDRSQWLLPIPLIQQGSRVRAYPGFDAGAGTLLGEDTRRGILPDGRAYDLSDGRGARLTHLGGNLDLRLAPGLTLRDKASWLAGRADTAGLVSAAIPPERAADLAASFGSSVASLRFVDDGTAASPDQPVVQAGVWIARKQVEAWVNDAAIEWRRGPNRATIGAYAARSLSRDRWNIGNTLLLAATPHGRRLDMTLADGAAVTRNGFAGGSSFLVDARYAANDLALYGADELDLTDRLRIDGGLRYQWHHVAGHSRPTLPPGPGGTDGDPQTLYDNADVTLSPAPMPVRYDGGALAWTIGANYAASARFGAFARLSRGHSFPFFDNLRDGIRVAPRVDTIEAGVKLTGRALDLYATAFRNRFRGLAATVISTGAPQASLGNARATGVEIEGTARPAAGLTVRMTATWLDARYRRFFADGGATDLSGDRVQRQPRWQWQVEPAWERRLGRATGRLFSTIRYTGARYSDVQNRQFLPAFVTWGTGAGLGLGRFDLQIVGDNLLDTIGLTESNPRTIGAQAAGPIFGRAILGRSAEISARWSF